MNPFRAGRGLSLFARLLAVLLATLLALPSAGCARPSDGPPPIREGTIQALGPDDVILLDDAIGSLAEETTGSGATKGSFATYPYGLTRYDTTTSTRKYAGTPRDVGIGLDQMGARSYAPDLGVWTSVDPIALTNPERGLRASFAANNPYAYAGDGPLIGVDRDGHCVFLIVAAILIGSLITAQYANAPEHEDTPLLHKSDADLALDTAHNSALIYGTATAGIGAAGTISAEGILVGGAKVGSQLVQGAVAAEGVHQIADAADPSGRLGKVADIAMVAQSIVPDEGLAARVGPKAGNNTTRELHRPYLRSSTRKAIEGAALRDANGRPIDPNTGKPIQGKPDVGHKTGNEFRREKATARAQGLSQPQFNDRMNDPTKYQLEDPSSNRSHQYEQKP